MANSKRVATFSDWVEEEDIPGAAGTTGGTSGASGTAIGTGIGMGAAYGYGSVKRIRTVEVSAGTAGTANASSAGPANSSTASMVSSQL